VGLYGSRPMKFEILQKRKIMCRDFIFKNLHIENHRLDLLAALEYF
jgi:hypothetical protein